MKVEKVNLNISSAQYQAQKPVYRISSQPDQTSFKGNISQSVIEKEINALNTPMLRGINKLKSNIGELQDICINALGTGLLAPIFIKYNPLSKTDEDTRTYSAWRQPVSAVLAVATQGTITIPFVKCINSMANTGWFDEECNMTPFKDKNYVEKMMKKLHPEMTKKQLTDKVNEFIENQDKELINGIKKENTVFYNFRNVPDPKKMDENKYKDLLRKTVDDMIKDEKEQLERCDKTKLPKRVERSEFYRTHYDESKSLLEEMSEKINNTEKVSDIKSYLKNKYKALKANKANKHLLDIISETKDLANAGKSDMAEKVNKMLGHVEKYKGFTSREAVAEEVQKSIASRVTEHKDTIKFLEDVQKAITDGKTASEIETMFTQKVKQLKEAGKEFRLADKVFSEEVASKLKTITKKHIEGVKRISTLVVALAMLPITCSLLNWIYPRFMDAVFPNLSNKKHGNEAKELVEKATKNSEVK